MSKSFALAIDSPAMQAVGAPTVVDGLPVQRFVKKIIPQGHFVKRDQKTKKVLWELDVDRPRQDQWVDAFKAMNTAGVAVRLMDDTGNFTLESPKSPLTKNHAGVFDKSRSGRLKKMAEAVVGDTKDLFVDEADGWVTAIIEARGQEQIDLCKRAQFTSPEIDPCFIDGTDKKHGEAITAISIVWNPLVPGQTGFQPIAASADSPERYVLSLDTGETKMPLSAALAAMIAIMANVSPTQVTEESAPDLLKGVHTRLQDTEGKLTKALSADSPNLEVAGLTARAAETVIKSTLTGVLSDAGIAKLTQRLVGDRATKKFSTFILSADDADGAVDAIEAICKDIKENLSVKKGAKSEQQDTKALSADGEEGDAKGVVNKLVDAHIQSRYGIKADKE